MTATVAVVAALVLVPGAGAALAFAPPAAVSVETRIALAFGLGYGLAAGAAIVLVLAHVFFLATFVAALVVVAVAAWVLAVRRAPLREHAAGLREQAREAPFTLGAGLVLLATVAGVWLARDPLHYLAHRPAWRYWADGLEVAADGHVATQSQQWGMEIPTTVSKVALNAFEGGVALLMGPEPLSGMHGILVVAAVGVVAALLALGRELGLGVFAPLVPAFVILVPLDLPLGRELSHDLTRFTAENVGRMAAFCAVVAAIHAWRVRSRAPALVAGGLLAAAALTHGIPMLIAVLVLAFYALGAVIVDRGRLRSIVVRGVLMVAVLGVAYVGVIGLSGGDLGFEGAGGKVTEGFPPDVDPTRSFTYGRFLPPIQKEGHFLIPPRELVRTYAEATVNRAGRAREAFAGLAVLSLAALLLAWGRRSLVPAITVAWGLALTILGLAFFFSYRYETQIPGVFGVRRLYDYAVLVPALLGPTVLAGAAALLWDERRGRLRSAVALAVGAIAVATALGMLGKDRGTRPGERGLDVIASVASVVPCDARMVANARTAGTWEATIGRPALTEGRAPFLQSDVLHRVLDILVGANEFFADPQANRDFLERQRVDYVVAVSPRVWFGRGGTGRVPEEDDADGVAALPEVETVLRNDNVAIFAATPEAAARAGGQPSRCPL
jgi:hypothetical protein